jgi:hypothetical protein
MVWAAIVASMSVFSLLWCGASLFRHLPRRSLVLAPAALFSVGALGWSLWSGMEVAFFLGLWGPAVALAAALADRDQPPEVLTESDTRDQQGGTPLSSAALAWALGGLGVLLVLTRPEGATSLAVLGLYGAIGVGRARGAKAALGALARVGLPAVVALVAQAVANRLLTGETSANGAIVKLALNNPYMTAAEKLADYRFNLDYVYDRVTLHHFGEPRPWEPPASGLWGRLQAWAVEAMRRRWWPKEIGFPWGRVPLWLGFLGLLDRRTRGPVLLLWASAASWVLVVSMNGQVRWQNERYVMPAVAWVLLAGALGLAAAVLPRDGARRAWPRAVGGSLLAAYLLGHFWEIERIQYRDQVWFMARASRNIRDQHTTAGRTLARLSPAPHRVLVGDAGALLYSSDLPGFDLIGLGGYHQLPLARAGVHGLPATLELIERLPAAERPDVMAIYPTWWPWLPRWFGRELFSVPVRGNVICGGAEKVIYRSDWSLLGTGAQPRTLRPGERVLDEVDIADLISEKEHNYAFPQPQGGWAEMRVLPDPSAPELDLFDAGRRIPNDRAETLRLRGLTPGKPIRILFRTIVDQPSEIELSVGPGTSNLALPASAGWSEPFIEIPAAHVTREMDVRLTPRKGEWVGYHVWAVGAP